MVFKIGFPTLEVDFDPGFVRPPKFGAPMKPRCTLKPVNRRRVRILVKDPPPPTEKCFSPGWLRIHVGFIMARRRSLPNSGHFAKGVQDGTCKMQDLPCLTGAGEYLVSHRRCTHHSQSDLWDTCGSHIEAPMTTFQRFPQGVFR